VGLSRATVVGLSAPASSVRSPLAAGSTGGASVVGAGVAVVGGADVLGAAVVGGAASALSAAAAPSCGVPPEWVDAVRSAPDLVTLSDESPPEGAFSGEAPGGRSVEADG
jgi:hypothetical protein